MLLEALRGEFEHEAANTRKLLEAVPADATGFRITDFGWTLGELAQHIATIYYWYVGALTQDVYNISEDAYARGDSADMGNSKALFEKNLEQARAALYELKEEDLFREWTMKAGDNTVIGPMPRLQVIRGFLFNHLYHHRGELVVYLRAAGAPVPGLYGPTYEESRAAAQKQPHP